MCKYEKKRMTKEALPFWPLWMWLSRVVSLIHICESQFWIWATAKLVNWIRIFFNACVVLSKSCLILMSCLWRQSWSFIGWDWWSPQIVKLHVKSYYFVCLKIYWLLVWCAYCFMHLIIGFSLNIFLIDWVMGYPGRVMS